ncbi:MAG TPA: hypothetical protein VGK59_11210 [Ohtaekwangia sp.]
MKRGILLVIWMTTVTTMLAQTSPYVTSGGELIFSASNYDGDGAIRFSPVINIQNLVNFDRTESFGFFTGLSVRNIGFIYDESDAVRKKVRTYNLGIPVGIKVGKLDGRFIYLGYELEIPLNYKEKTFINEDKEDKFNTWFSERTPGVYHTVMVGLQLPYGSNIKFKYYLTPFFDDSYDGVNQDGTPIVYPDVNVFYVSLNYALFKNEKFYYTSD